MGETTTRIALTTAAILAVVIVVSAFLLVRGYNQNLPPSASNNVTNSGQNWPIFQPIEIQFNKPMNHESVLENLQIFPPGELGRIPTSWDHNTLILGSSPSQSTPFLPDTSYRVLVLAGARDIYGHALTDTVTVPFHTSAIADASQTPTPTPAASTQATKTPGQSQQSANVPPPALTKTETTTPTVQSTPASTNPSETATATATKAPTPSPTPERATATPTSISNSASSPTLAPTATPTQSATSVETPSATTSTAGTSEATPSASPSPDEQTAAATPVASATPNDGTATTAVIPVTGAFGSVFWANSDVQAKLGDAQAPEAHLNAAELGFQRGTMYERFDTSQIYVLFADSQWNRYPDTWTAAEGEGGGMSPEDPQLSIPNGSFGKVWNSDPNLSKSIGYAVNSDEHVMGGVVQQFTHGIMLYSDQGFVYVLYDDSSWMLYPDTSGHGDLITPTSTPSTSETPTGTPVETPTPDATDATTPQSTAP